MFLRGVVGERFCVRNSGATVVAEGVGDHACEYMTGGRAVVLGPTGRNFAAGMSGGIAYILDEAGNFDTLCNQGMVELEPIDANEADDGTADVASDPMRYDARRLKGLIENHLRYTGSSRAKHILDNWDSYLPKFIKITPVDYRRALREMQERAAGTETAALAGE